MMALRMYSRKFFGNRFSTRAFGSASKNRTLLNISGIYPPITTPFDIKGNIDLVQLGNNFDHWNQIPFAGRFKPIMSNHYLKY